MPGGTVKPKLGFSAKDYATIIYECLVGGLDTTNVGKRKSVPIQGDTGDLRLIQFNQAHAEGGQHRLGPIGLS